MIYILWLTSRNESSSYLQTAESHAKEEDSLSSRLLQAEQDLHRLNFEHQNKLVLAAASDEKHQGELDALRSQLEGRYEQHLGLLKNQYEAQSSRLQDQLSSLHAHFQERASPRRNSSMLNNGDASYGSGATLDRTGRSDQGSASVMEREELEKRIRQAEARSIALTQQLQSMPSSLQVTDNGQHLFSLPFLSSFIQFCL